MTLFFDALIPLVDVFERLEVAYYIGGSVATMAHGVPRTTLDVDVVADVRPTHIDELVRVLQHNFYIQADEIRDAITHRSAFNVVHFASMVKIDVFVAPHRAFDHSKAQRAHTMQISPHHTRQFRVTSAEDIILQKLEWYALGEQISERQWRDVQGVLHIQGDALDIAYLRYWAAQLTISDLLERALTEARLS